MDIHHDSVGVSAVAVELPHPEVEIVDRNRLAAGEIEAVATPARDAWFGHSSAWRVEGLNLVLSAATVLSGQRPKRAV